MSPTNSSKLTLTQEYAEISVNKVFQLYSWAIVGGMHIPYTVFILKNLHSQH
jgi:hypothetical protein